MEHTPKEEEIREEFQKWLSAETTFAYGIPDDRTIADYWLRIRREAIAEEKRRIKKIIKWVYQNAKENHICRFNDGDCNCECYYTAINDILVHLTQEEETKKAKYVLDGRKPYWELPDGTRESYTHQDGNYSNQCACEYCRCNQ